MTSTNRSELLRAQLSELYGLTCIPQWGTMRDLSRKTYGGRVARIAAELGTPLMPWQRYVADVALEIDPLSGLFAYRGVDLLVPRQSGKTSLILPVAVHRGLAWQNQRIIYGAQSGSAAREKWEDEHLFLLGNSKKLKPKFRVRKANGREAIIWRKTNSIHGLIASTRKAGHGKTLDLVLADEYFAQVDGRLDAAVGPAMITRVMAQKWRFSTAGTSESVPLNKIRERGRLSIEEGRPSKIAFFDWTAPVGAARDDPEVWRLTMPALCPAPVRGICRCSKLWRHTVTDDAIRTELESCNGPDDLADWDRAYYNHTRDTSDVVVDPNVPSLAAWKLLANATAAKTGPRLACGVDINPARDYAAIVAVGDGPEGLPLMKVLDHGPGIHWVLGRIMEIDAELRPVAWAIDDRSPAGTLVTPLANLVTPQTPQGIRRMSSTDPRRGQLWIPTTAEYAAACAGFADAVNTGALVHTGQESATAAIEGLRSRPLGDGAYGWGRKIGAADITPVVGGTLGLAAYVKWSHLDDDYDVMDSIY